MRTSVKKIWNWASHQIIKRSRITALKDEQRWDIFYFNPLAVININENISGFLSLHFILMAYKPRESSLLNLISELMKQVRYESFTTVHHPLNKDQ